MSVSYFDAWEGLDSPACPNYVPTKHELMVLSEYWLHARWFVGDARVLRRTCRPARRGRGIASPMNGST